MKVAYDIRHLQKPNLDDGASRYSFELLKALTEADASLKFYYLGYTEGLSGTCLDELVGKSASFIGGFERRGSTSGNYALTQVLYPRVLRSNGIDLFHALFQTE